MSLSHARHLSPNYLKYCAYFGILSPLYIAWNMMPVYLFLSGIRPLHIGALYAFASFVEILVPHIIGSRFRQVNLNQVMALDNFLSGISYLCFATGNPWAFGVGLVLLRGAHSLSSVYATYDHCVFPEEERVKARAFYLALPEVSQAIVFLGLGIILGVAWPHVEAFETAFAIMGFLSIVATLLPLWWLPTQTGDFDLTTVNIGGQWSLLMKPIVVIDLLIYLASCLVPMVVWTMFVVDTLQGTFFLVALVEIGASLGIVFTARFVSQTNRTRDVVIGLALMGVTSLALVTRTTPTVMILVYLISSIGDTLWDPHHTDLLYAAIPATEARRFFGSLASIKTLIAMASLPIATAILEINGRINFGLSAAITLLALALYIRLFLMSHRDGGNATLQ